MFDLHDKSDNEIIEFVNNYFKTRGKHGFISKFTAAGIDCVEEIHYSSGGFNNTLLYLLSITSDKHKFDKYIDDQLYNLSKELSSGGDLSA